MEDFTNDLKNLFFIFIAVNKPNPAFSFTSELKTLNEIFLIPIWIFFLNRSFLDRVEKNQKLVFLN